LPHPPEQCVTGALQDPDRLQGRPHPSPGRLGPPATGLHHPEDAQVIEIDQETLDELEHGFRFNDAILRHLTLARDEAVTAPSPMMKGEKARNLLVAQPSETAPAEVAA
jgi:hypothetical protein